MKWFKHYAGGSENAKIQQLEARLGLKGYAAYFKILELCAEQYDGVSDSPFFVFNYVTLQNKLRMKRKAIQNQFRTGVELNFWKAEVNEFEVILEVPKLLEYRHKDSMSSKFRRAGGGVGGGPRIEENRLEVEEEEKAFKKKHPIHKFHESFSRHEDSSKFESWISENEIFSPKLGRESSKIMASFRGFENFSKWWDGATGPNSKITKLENIADKKRYAVGAILKEAGVDAQEASA